VAALAAHDDDDEIDGVEALLQQGGAKVAGTAKSAPTTAAPQRVPAAAAAAAQPDAPLVIPVGVINLHSQQLRVSLFESLADPAWLTLTMEKAQLLLDQHMDRRGVDGIHRELSLILGESRRSKMSERGGAAAAAAPAAAAVAAAPSADTWIDARHAHASEVPIFTLPASTLIMYSHQRVRSSRVEFYFVTDFESSVQVAITGVDYIPEILTLYSNAVDEAKRLVVVRAPTDAPEGGASKAVAQGGLRQSAVSLDGTDAAASAAAITREFVCKKFVLNPILNSIRHTPSIETVLDWLKVRNSREFIPYHTHVMFTDPLELLLTALWNFAVEVETNTIQVVHASSAVHVGERELDEDEDDDEFFSDDED